MVEKSTVLAEPLIRATVPAALSAVSMAAEVGSAVSPSVADLATGVMKSMFLKKLQTVAVATFVAAAVAATALTGVVADRSEAAPVPAGAPVPPGKINDELPPDLHGRLLMNRKVLKELKCDMEQFDRIMDQLEAAEKLAAQKSSEVMGQMRINAVNANMAAAAFDQMFKDAQEEGEKEFRKAVGIVTATLTPSQRMRLRQIDLQARGPAAFTTPAVAKALDLTAKQKEQLEANTKQVEEAIAQASQAPFAGVPGVVGVARVNGAAAGGGRVVFNGVTQFDFEKTLQEARGEGMKRALALVTEEQRTVWNKLIGEPFKHPLGNVTGPRGGTFRMGGMGGGGVMVPGFPAVPAQILPARPIPVQPPPAGPGM